ncbi:glycine zipper domain-containing protein [Pseudomonas sp. BN102]|uniref:glycine zipper domain-containing protein n=1 Tax=Pseudomonas sp. BN102 TaxID=2567886 RepID=UPI0024550F5A|nr:glycine zipper domain-containing protein [Pseudomonas sp. BN102]
MKRSLLFAAVLTAAGVIGCTSMTPQQQGTMSGAAIGAVAGGVAGNIKGSKQQK